MSGDRNNTDEPLKCCSDSYDELTAVRLIGRGGQGIVTAGELLALAAFSENKHAQAIPHFGAERRGGPAYCSLRISDLPILLKCNVLDADIICVFDPTIWHFKNMFFGLKDQGIIIFNTRKSAREIHNELSSDKYGYSLPVNDYEIFTVDATSLSLDILSRPIVNTAMMGAFAKATGIVNIDTIKDVISAKIKRDTDKNCNLAQKAFDGVDRYKTKDGA